MEPTEATCLNSRYSFEEELSALRCKRETESYLRQLNEYVGCLERAKETGLQRVAQTLSKLNCRLRGSLGC
jgi:hypothetical protein